MVLCAAIVLLALAATTSAGAQTVGPALDVDQTVNRSTVTAGEVVGVNVTLNASAPRFEGPGLNASLPAGWTLVPETADGGDYKAGATAWVWLDTADTKNVTYAVPVPASATGTYALTGRGSAIDTTVGPDGRRNTTSAASTVTVNRPPDAGFVYAPSQPAVGATVSFNDSSTDDGSLVAWSWEFGDGTTAPGENVSHSYAAPGTYAVNLTVTDGDGATDTVTHSVPVGNDPPDASIQVTPSDPAVGETVQFDGTGSSDTDGTVTSYDWDFGDGDTGTGSTPVHSYGSTGSYTATLTVTDDDGATDVATTTISVSSGGGGPQPGGFGGGGVGGGGGGGGEGGSVERSRNQTPESTPQPDSGGGGNLDPIPAISTPLEAGPNGTVVLDASDARDPDGTVVSYEWDVDGDGVFARDGRRIEIRPGAGRHAVGLRVTDDDGARNTTRRNVTVPAELVRVEEDGSSVPVVALALLLLLGFLAYGVVRYRRGE